MPLWSSPCSPRPTLGNAWRTSFGQLSGTSILSAIPGLPKDAAITTLINNQPPQTSKPFQTTGPWYAPILTAALAARLLLTLLERDMERDMDGVLGRPGILELDALRSIRFCALFWRDNRAAFELSKRLRNLFNSSSRAKTCSWRFWGSECQHARGRKTTTYEYTAWGAQEIAGFRSRGGVHHLAREAPRQLARAGAIGSVVTRPTALTQRWPVHARPGVNRTDCIVVSHRTPAR